MEIRFFRVRNYRSRHDKGEKSSNGRKMEETRRVACGNEYASNRKWRGKTIDVFHRLNEVVKYSTAGERESGGREERVYEIAEQTETRIETCVSACVGRACADARVGSENTENRSEAARCIIQFGQP